MIYLLEDDDNIREFTVYALKKSGLDTLGLALPSDFWKAVEKELPSLVLLDIMLPEEDGLSVLCKLKANSKTGEIPVMMLTAKNTEYDKVLGLDSGADDYLAKPFGIMELISRVRALLRRTKVKMEQSLVLGNLSIHPSQRKVIIQEEEIILTCKEYDLLYYLATHCNIVLTRENILQAVWSIEFVGESRTVDVHIRSLRAKLGECGNQIETVRGVGYRFNNER